MNRQRDVDSGQSLMPAEAFTPENRAKQFEVIAWGHSSDEFEVDAFCDEGEAMVHCEVRRRQESPKFGQPLQRHEVSGVLEALNLEAGELGGEGTGLWTPDSENEYVQENWSRMFTFHLDDPVDLFQPLLPA